MLVLRYLMIGISVWLFVVGGAIVIHGLVSVARHRARRARGEQSPMMRANEWMAAAILIGVAWLPLLVGLALAA